MAVARIEKAIANREKIYIYGDYDVDGITSSCLIQDFSASKGVDINYYLPDRFEGATESSVGRLEKIVHNGADLVISVDCGIVSVDEAPICKNRA